MCFVLALCSVAVRRDVLPTTYFAFASPLLLHLLLLCFALFVFALALAAVYGYSQPAVNRLADKPTGAPGIPKHQKSWGIRFSHKKESKTNILSTLTR